MDADRPGPDRHTETLDVSIVMPCLNEVQCLPHCIEQAKAALAAIERNLGLKGEVLIADNGSTDGSQSLATKLGARVVAVSERGYGAAIRGGFTAARGRFLVMGDADGSYDFRDAEPMIAALMRGADLVMGSRFKGGIRPGAMPWKNRYIGNPVLTGILNLLFQTGAGDAHCGLRAITRASFDRLRLSGAGMEFASEMLIKAALKGETIVETPVVLHPDLRDRPPHLRPWRDGWRHLRYLFMLSPSWLFGVPAAVVGAASLTILMVASAYALLRPGEIIAFGNYWVILAAAMVGVSQVAAILALASHLYGVREGYRRPKAWTASLARWLSLETMLLSGLGFIALGIAVLTAVVVSWTGREFGATYNVLPPVVGALLLTLGVQNALGGFILAIVAGNEARFLNTATPPVELEPAAATRPAHAA
jgi:glycosyltransferase involved in cell wall biosynthesis